MSRKVFISFLGTNNYLQTSYKYSNGENSRPVRFIQEALILSECKNWTEQDKIYIFCTKDACINNWENKDHLEKYNEKEEKDQEIERIGLKKRLEDNYNLFKIVEKVDIKEGFSEDEIWDIFECVYEKLQPQDEIYFDVTHAFRSIPLFSTVLFNYSRFMKETKIVSIKYGAFEKLGPAYKVKNIPISERVAPILDLTNIVRLQEYTDMASSLTTFGRIKNISQGLIDKNLEIQPVIQQLSKAINDFDNDLLTNRMGNIKAGKNVKVFRDNFKALRKIKSIPIPIKNIIKKLDEKLSDFVEKEDNKNIEAAINWATEYKMLPQAYTLGQEYIISLLANEFAERNPYSSSKGKITSKEKKLFREFLSSICSIREEDIKEEKFYGKLKENISLTKQLLQEDLILKLRENFASFGSNRNAVNHGKGDVSYESLVEDFYNDFYPMVKLFNHVD